MKDYKYRKILLLGFDKKLVEEFFIINNVIVPSCFTINCVEDSIRKYGQIITQLHTVDGVFFDDIIRVIHKGIRYYQDSDSLSSPSKMVDRLNKLIHNIGDKILVIQFEDSHDDDLEYLYSRITDKIIIDDILQLKRYINK